MSASVIHGTYHAGRVDLDSPVDWPEGWRVSVVSESETIGLREEDWPDTPENRAEILRRMAAVEPLEFTAEDEARIASTRAEMKAKSIEAMRQLMGLQP